MLNADQFARRSSSLRREASASCRTRTPTGSTPSTGPVRPGAQRRAVGRRPRKDYRISLSFLDQDGIIDGNSTRRIGPRANFNQRLANDRLNLRFNLRGTRTDDRFTPLGVLSNAAQFGPTQPVLDPATAPVTTTGRDGSDVGGQSGGDPGSRRGKGHDLSRHRQRAGRVPAAVDRRAPGQRQPRLRRRPTADRKNFTPSVLHREVGDRQRRHQTRFNPSRPTRCSRPTSTTRRRAGRPGHARPDRRVLLDQDPHRLARTTRATASPPTRWRQRRLVAGGDRSRTSCSSRRAS